MLKYDLPKFLLISFMLIYAVIYFITTGKNLTTKDMFALVILLTLFVLYLIKRKSVRSGNTK